MRASSKSKSELTVRGMVVRVSGAQSGGGGTESVLFLRCFFLVLRHTPGTPGTGFTSLLLTGGGCRIGLGARVRHTGSPAAQSRIPVIPAGVAWAVRGGASSRPRPPRASHPSVIGCTPRGASLSDSVPPACIQGSWGSQVDERGVPWASPPPPPQVEAERNDFCGPRPPWCQERVCPRGPAHELIKGWSQEANRWAHFLTSCILVGWLSPARAGWTGPVPFKFFTGSAGTLRREEKRLQSPHQRIKGPWA